MGVVEWGALATLIATLGTLGGMQRYYLSAIAKAQSSADAAKTSAESAGLAVSALRLEMMHLEAAFVEHRVSVAKEYVSKDTLASLETRIVEAINKLGDRLDRLFQNPPR